MCDEEPGVEYVHTFHYPSPILDNFGITISMEAMPTRPNYRLCRDRMYGTGFLSSLWCQHLRPLLRRGKQAQIERAWEDAKLHFQQDLLTAVIAAGAEVEVKEVPKGIDLAHSLEIDGAAELTIPSEIAGSAGGAL